MVTSSLILLGLAVWVTPRLGMLGTAVTAALAFLVVCSVPVVNILSAPQAEAVREPAGATP